MQAFRFMILCLAFYAKPSDGLTVTSEEVLPAASDVIPLEFEIRVEIEFPDVGAPLPPTTTQNGYQRIHVPTYHQAVTSNPREAGTTSRVLTTQDASGTRASLTGLGGYPVAHTISQSTIAEEIVTAVGSNTSFTSGHAPITRSDTTSIQVATGFYLSTNLSNSTARPANLSVFAGSAAAPNPPWPLNPLVLMLLVV